MTSSWLISVTTQQSRPHKQEIAETRLKRCGQVNAHKMLDRKSIQLIWSFLRPEACFGLAAKRQADSTSKGQ